MQFDEKKEKLTGLTEKRGKIQLFVGPANLAYLLRGHRAEVEFHKFIEFQAFVFKSPVKGVKTGTNADNLGRGAGLLKKTDVAKNFTDKNVPFT